MALEHKNLKDEIKSKKLTFNDDYFSLKNNYIATTNGINYFAYDALKDVNDVKSNNFSNLILTKKQKNSDIIDVKKINPEKYLDIVTTLSFFSGNPNDALNPGVWLSVENSYNNYDVDLSASSIKLTAGKNNEANNYLFRLECIDDKYCKISHTFNGATYYLSYNNGFFLTTNRNDNTDFTYLIDNKKLKLYKIITNHGLPIIYSVCCEYSKGYWSLLLKKGDVKENGILYINEEEESLSYLINANWIKYDRKNAINTIDKSKSAFNLESQAIIHHEYSDKSNNINIIPLKNTLTYQGTATNGSNITLSSNGKYIETPLVDYRNYVALNSGYNQEGGTENITLTFTFSDQVYRLNPGDECIFSIDEKDESNMIYPLYPYESININDSAFVRNGAFASNVPYFADKFKKLQNHNTSSSNDYTYLCTWLYQPDENTVPVWLDRWYYPNYMSKKEALASEQDGKIFECSFENILDNFYLNPEILKEENWEKYGITSYTAEELKNFAAELNKQAYVDKKSDLLIEPGTTYRYSRLSREMIDEVWNRLEPDRIDIVKDQNSNDVLLEDEFTFNDTTWREINTENFKNTQKINFNTNLYINPQKKLGIQLFGCDYKYGFNIQNRKDLSPFIYYVDNSSIYMLNNSYQICNRFNLGEKYGEEITYFVNNSPFDDLYIFTLSSLFILDYDLRLKNRIKLEDIFSNIYVDNVTSLITQTHIIEYNKNLYAVIEKDILKIIFNPENEKDKEALRGQNISARILSKNEYFTNFNMVENPELLQTSHTIKSLYIKNGILYAFNYDIVKMSHDGDTVYGIIKEKVINESWYYIFNQSLDRIFISEAASKYAEFSSQVSIDSITFGPGGCFALIRGFEGEGDDNKCLEIYDRSKTKIYNYPLKDYQNIISLDYYRYINENAEETEVFLALMANNGYLTIIEYDIKNEKINNYFTGLSDKCVSGFRGSVDSNSFITKLDENKIYFNLYLQDGVSVITHEWNLLEAQEGWYNINVEIDMDEAVFNIKINDKLVGEYNNTTHPAFIPHQHTNTSIFDATYYYGVVGKKFGTTLNQILNGVVNKDPYSIKNSKTENTTLYIRNLEYYEYQANRLNFNKINPLILTLPCGIRNGIEEIIRYFKFNKPSSYSNKVKINISGIDGVKTGAEVNALKTNIANALAESDCLITVKDIEFI